MGVTIVVDEVEVEVEVEVLFVALVAAELMVSVELRVSTVSVEATEAVEVLDRDRLIPDGGRSCEEPMDATLILPLLSQRSSGCVLGLVGVEKAEGVGLAAAGGGGVEMMGPGEGLPAWLSAAPLPAEELCPLSREPRDSTEHCEVRGMSPSPASEPSSSTQPAGLTDGGGEPSSRPGSVGLTEGISTHWFTESH